MKKILKTEEALELISDEDVIVTTGFTLTGSAEALFKGLKAKFKKNKVPNNLTLVHSAGLSDRQNGIEHLAEEGLITKIIGSHWGDAPKIRKMITDNKIEAHCLPQGQLTHLFRAAASGKPGILTKVGLNTFIDPRLEGGLMNEKALKTGTNIEIHTLKNEEYLFYKTFPLNIALIRGTTADENGNITMEDEPLKLETLSIAQAVKRYGGKVIVQVKNLAKSGDLHARKVIIPGIYVDAVVVSENPHEDHRQSSGCFYSPTFTGEIKEPNNSFSPMKLKGEKIIGRRGAMELHNKSIVNLGVGMPGNTIGSVSREEGIDNNITLTVEAGTIGGVPEGKKNFGMAKNPQAIIEHSNQFDYYIGTGIDITFMGAAEINSNGDVNVSKFGDRTVGCGGFIDITQPAKKVVFLSTFTTNGLQTEVKNGKLNIVQEGKTKKFVNNVNQTTFSSLYANSINQPVFYITERAVFKLQKNGIELIEYAPGIDVEKDIIAQMGFHPKISSSLKKMPGYIFEDGVAEIKKIIDEKSLNY